MLFIWVLKSSWHCLCSGSFGVPRKKVPEHLRYRLDEDTIASINYLTDVSLLETTHKNENFSQQRESGREKKYDNIIPGVFESIESPLFHHGSHPYRVYFESYCWPY